MSISDKVSVSDFLARCETLNLEVARKLRPQVRGYENELNLLKRKVQYLDTCDSVEHGFALLSEIDEIFERCVSAHRCIQLWFGEQGASLERVYQEFRFLAENGQEETALIGQQLLQRIQNVSTVLEDSLCPLEAELAERVDDHPIALLHADLEALYSQQDQLDRCVLRLKGFYGDLEISSLARREEQLWAVREQYRVYQSIIEKFTKRYPSVDVQNITASIEDSARLIAHHCQITSRLREIYSPHWFHVDCDTGRAEGLLRLHPAGTFLLRESKKPKCITLSFHDSDGQCTHVCLEINPLGELTFDGRPVSPKEVVTNLGGVPGPTAIPDGPVDPALFNNPSTEPTTLEELFHYKVHPYLEAKNQNWIKLSRRTYPFLRRSVVVSRKGEFYECYHRDSKHFPDGTIISGALSKRLVGEGGYKQVVQLRPFYPTAELPDRVRSRTFTVKERFRLLGGAFGAKSWLKNEQLRGQRLAESCETLAIMRREFGDHPNLLIPDQFSYKRAKGTSAALVYAQVMPEMDGDITDLYHDLSPKGRIWVAVQLAQAIVALHSRNYVHFDIKPQNVLFRKTKNPDQPEIRLADLDLCAKVGPEFNEMRGNFLYGDPLIMKQKYKGIKQAKVGDQFSFGATLHEILCGERVGRKYDEVRASKLVTEEMLQRVDGFSALDSSLQTILRTCLIGSERTYRLPQILKQLQQLLKTL